MLLSKLKSWAVVLLVGPAVAATGFMHRARAEDENKAAQRPEIPGSSAHRSRFHSGSQTPHRSYSPYAR
jgi:hypothetical protein